jgi:mono/diheme cytochrome c family protein
MARDAAGSKRGVGLFRKITVAFAVLLVVGLAGGAYAWTKFFREVPQEICGDVEPARRTAICADAGEEWFKYGSLGAEWELGVPYPMFHVLPRVFADLMPGPGGYRAFGLPWEEGRELPVGFSKKTVGFPRVTQTCAVCHAASYRVTPDAAPVIVPTGPSHTTNVMAFLDFLEAAANDPRWSGDGMLPEMERNFDLGWDDKLIYRYLIIPIAKKRILEQAADFAWMHAHDRPAWGPGRDGPFNLTKFNLIRLPDDGTVDNADFPSIWNATLRENTSMNWAGETQDPLAVYIDSALGLGAPPGEVTALMERQREYLRAKQPPPYPFAVDEALATQGRAVWQAECAACHEPGGERFGRTVPIDEIGTDRERFDTWQQAHADATNARAAEIGVTRKNMVKDVGYASQPLDGIWLRAPYLHNGSVPSLRALLMPPEERPATFWRGCDIYDPAGVGFRSTAPDDDCPEHRVLHFDTSLRGEGNGGHLYGTELPQDEKNALIEYLKTL